MAPGLRYVLCQFGERLGSLAVVTDESSIVVGEFEEGSQFFLPLWDCLFLDGLDLCSIHLDL